MLAITWMTTQCLLVRVDGDGDSTTKQQKRIEPTPSTLLPLPLPPPSPPSPPHQITLKAYQHCVCDVQRLATQRLATPHLLFLFYDSTFFQHSALGWNSTEIVKYTMIYANNHVFFLLIFSNESTHFRYLTEFFFSTVLCHCLLMQAPSHSECKGKSKMNWKEKRDEKRKANKKMGEWEWKRTHSSKNVDEAKYRCSQTGKNPNRHETSKWT